MNLRILAVGGLLIFSLLSCSSEDSSGNAGSEAQRNGAAEEPQHVWKGQVKALEKAQNLESDLDAAHQKRVDELERQMR